MNDALTLTLGLDQIIKHINARKINHYGQVDLGMNAANAMPFLDERLIDIGLEKEVQYRCCILFVWMSVSSFRK